MNPFAFAGGAIGAGVAFGVAVVGATTLGVDALRPPQGTEPNLGVPFELLVWGTLAGILLAAAVAWRLLSPLDSAYRRGGLALVSAFATVLAMLVCIPVNQILGRGGLAGLIALSLAVAILLARRTRAAAGTLS